MNYEQEVALERPLSEGDQIKVAIRTMFTEGRKGAMFDAAHPLRKHIFNVNGEAEKILCLHPFEDRRGAIVMWYEDVK